MGTGIETTTLQLVGQVRTVEQQSDQTTPRVNTRLLDFIFIFLIDIMYLFIYACQNSNSRNKHMIRNYQDIKIRVIEQQTS